MALNATNFAFGTVGTGDKLPFMRSMNSAFVDIICLDPLFNSNRDYAAPIGSEVADAAFKDTWTLSDVDHHEHGELAGRNPAACSVIASVRQAHGKSMQSYLIMLAVRLFEIRRVLKAERSIYLHCDDVAGPYLRFLMDRIFRKVNLRSEFILKRAAADNDCKQGRMQHGRKYYVLLYYSKGVLDVDSPFNHLGDVPYR